MACPTMRRERRSSSYAHRRPERTHPLRQPTPSSMQFLPSRNASPSHPRPTADRTRRPPARPPASPPAARASTDAATTPPIAPNRCACQEIRSCGSRPCSSPIPQIATTTTPIASSDRRLREDPPRHEVRGVAEHDAAGAEVDRVRRGDEPRPEPADDRDDQRDERHAHEAAERDRRAHRQKRHGVGDEVAEAGVQERRREDLRPARRRRADGCRSCRAGGRPRCRRSRAST